jgi:hypothetical protein
MSDAPANNAEPHPWAALSPEAVLEKLVYELYGPVSALGGEVDRLHSGAFEDDELMELIGQMRDAVNHLGRLVVTLKRYAAEHRPPVAAEVGEPIASGEAHPAEPAPAEGQTESQDPH